MAWLITTLPLPAETVDSDLLVVGGTESGVAAAVQAARMGVKSIVLVNDIDWLGGQFSAEALCAIDENRAHGGSSPTPFPRSGLFKEVVDRIEALNKEKYGLARPGNTVVPTTCQPAQAEGVFRELVAPYLQSKQLRIVSGYYPASAKLAADGKTLVAVQFAPVKAGGDSITVNARVTIDASDWGEAIRAAGAEYEFGPDLKSKYGEPSAPTDRSKYPITDMNPITWCLVVEETDTECPSTQPDRYDERRYYHITSVTNDDYAKVGWDHPIVYGAHPPAEVYRSRRLVDRTLAGCTASHDIVMFNRPELNYPLDVLPQVVVDELESISPGASKKNIVEMTRPEREVIFRDARLHSLGFFHFLNSTAHDRMQPADRRWSMRNFKLTDQFGTPDHLPPKPYVRESLRLQAMHMMIEQETHRDKDVDEYAPVMYYDGVGSWQFEYDFHPTGRGFTKELGPAGPWDCYGKPGRGWGPYTDRAILAMRSLIPVRVDGLLGAQKNLGYSSLVSSALRLHDQSMMVGQAAGAAAAVSLQHKTQPRAIPPDASLLAEVRAGLCSQTPGEIPLSVWPFADLAPGDQAYVAANLLAVRGGLPLKRTDIQFLPKEPATPEWKAAVVKRALETKVAATPPPMPEGEISRGEFITRWWNAVKQLPDAPLDLGRPLVLP